MELLSATYQTAWLVTKSLSTQCRTKRTCGGQQIDDELNFSETINIMPPRMWKPGSMEMADRRDEFFLEEAVPEDRLHPLHRLAVMRVVGESDCQQVLPYAPEDQ
jgi:hypothetical protein